MERMRATVTTWTSGPRAFNVASVKASWVELRLQASEPTPFPAGVCSPLPPGWTSPFLRLLGV